MKFINGYTQRERKNQDELERVHEKNFENPKLMRQILTVNFWWNVFVYGLNFLMYETLLWELKLVSTIFVFSIKITLEKLLKMILFYQKNSFCSRDFQIYVLPSSLFSSFFLFSSLLILWKKLIDDKFYSL